MFYRSFAPCLVNHYGFNYPRYLSFHGNNFSSVNQSINNFGYMQDVNQISNINQSIETSTEILENLPIID